MTACLGFRVVIEAAPHNYAAYAPDLPGCVATGKTKEDTLAAMREAVALHVNGLRRQEGHS